MFTSRQRFALVALTGAIMLGLTATASRGAYPTFNPNPNPAFTARGANIRFGAFGGVGVVGFNPYVNAAALNGLGALGINPFAAAAVNGFTGGSSLMAAAGAVAPAGNPFAGFANPYAGALAGGSATLTSTGTLPVNPGFGLAGGGSIMSNPYSAGITGTAPYSSPYGPYYSYTDPYQGYLMGAAKVIGEQGHFLQAREQAMLLRQKVYQEKLESRRKWFEEYLYERDHTPTLADEQKRIQAQELSRSINDPPVNEVLSSTALNTLLDYLEKQPEKAIPAIPLDDRDLRLVNVTKGGGGNIGLLKGGGRLNWPLALTGDKFEVERKKINSILPDAIDAVKVGRIDLGTIKELATTVETMKQQLSSSLKDMTADQGIEARRFLNNLEAAIRVLQQSDAKNYFNQSWAAKGASVPELVKFMKERGLRFAPAVNGDEEPGYVALQRALAAASSAAVSPQEKPEKQVTEK